MKLGVQWKHIWYSFHWEFGEFFFLSCNFLNFYLELQKIPLNNRGIAIYAHNMKQKEKWGFFVIFSFVYYQWVRGLRKAANYFEMLKPRARKLYEGNSKSWQTRMNEMMTRWRSLKIWQHSECCILLNKDLQILRDLAVWHRWLFSWWSSISLKFSGAEKVGEVKLNYTNNWWWQSDHFLFR